MTLLSTLSTVAPYHVLMYSLVFGATTYQSFFSGLVAFKTLPYKEFATLQHKVFPPYFAMQLASTAGLYLTAPGQLTQAGVTTLGIAAVGSLLNVVILGPRSAHISAKRIAQAESEGKSHKDPTASEVLKKLNKQFGKLHGISVLINLFVWGSLLTYGVVLTEQLTA